MSPSPPARLTATASERNTTGRTATAGGRDFDSTPVPAACGPRPGDGSFVAYRSRLAVVETKSYNLIKPQESYVYGGIAGRGGMMVDDAHYATRARLEGETDERAPPGAAGSGRLVRLVGWFVALVLVMAIAFAVFASAAHWPARRDVGSAREPVLQVARVTEQKLPLEVGAGLFAAGAVLALVQDSVMVRRVRKRHRSADADGIPEPEHATAKVAAESNPAAADLGVPKPRLAADEAPEPEPVAAGSAAYAAVGVPLRDGGAAEHNQRRGLFAAGARLALAPDSIMAQLIRRSQRALAGPVAAEAAEPNYAGTIEKLGSQELQVRVDCIYALERVARDSAADHPAVIESLTAFIRQHSDELWPPGDSGDLEQEQSVRPDVQAALTVIGRRKKEWDLGFINLMGARLVRAYLTWANLGGMDLRYADLGGANLHGAYLTRADLSGARLVATDLTRANLSRAYLQGAYLTRAHLSGANLSWANLTDADLTAADLHGTDLTGADLHGAYLTAANLTGANLTRADLTSAVLVGACVTSVDISGAMLADARWTQQAVLEVGWQYE